MAFCVQCGTKLEEGAKFCTECGAKQPAGTPAAPVPPVEEPAAPQTSYTYDPTVYEKKPQTEKKKGKGGKIGVILLAALVVIAALFFIFKNKPSGSQSVPADDPILGLYNAEKAEMAGINISVSSMWEKGFTIELRQKGKAAVNVDGTQRTIKWTLDGEDFTLKGSGLDCSGTLKDGVITLDNVMDSGVTLYFMKEGGAIPAPPAPSETPAEIPAETPAPETPAPETPAPETPAPETPAPETPAPETPAEAPAESGIIGTYNADKAEAFGAELSVADMWAKGFSIDLQEGGTCTVSVEGNSSDGTWSADGDAIKISIPGFDMTGTLQDGVLKVENILGMGVTLYFSKDAAAVPAEKPAAQVEQPKGDYSWWKGNWFGWWVIADGGGVYQEKDFIGYAWDACAIITVNDDGTGYIESWDEENDYIAVGDIVFAQGLTEKGSMTNKNVKFWDYQVPEGEWSADPGSDVNAQYANTIVISGRYEDPENEGSWFSYHIFLRPWGMLWDDIEEDLLPYNYENWYLPLINSGEEMPDLFEGLE